MVPLALVRIAPIDADAHGHRVVAIVDDTIIDVSIDNHLVMVCRQCSRYHHAFTHLRFAPRVACCALIFPSSHNAHTMCLVSDEG